MSEQCVLNVDLADVWAEKGRKGYIRTIAWGDEITVVDQQPKYIEIEYNRFEEKPDGSILPVPFKGFIEPTKASGKKTSDIIRPADQNCVLKVNFVDVQQGDGAVIESPDGKIILVDAGDNQLFARYLAGRFRGTSPENPKVIDCIVITHGDSDHFVGFSEILKSEKNPEIRKRLYIKPLRVFHNGLVKRPGKKNGRNVPDKDLFGDTAEVGDGVVITGLVDNLLEVPDTEMNTPFRSLKKTLRTYNDRDPQNPIMFHRLQAGDQKAFRFFEDNNRGIKIEVLGPLMYKKNGIEGLKFMGEPHEGPRGNHPVENDEDFKGLSASHTINGHSVVFRLVYNNFRYLFTGDLNDQAGRMLLRDNTVKNRLASEVFKVPHHGSADFCNAFLEAVSPVISIVSSGDESAQKDYIHPRATLMGALGQCSRIPEPLVFVTELIACFTAEGWSQLTDESRKAKERGRFYGFSRAAYGILKTRTDGSRLLVYTDSGNVRLKEAYAFTLDASGIPEQVPICRV